MPYSVYNTVGRTEISLGTRSFDIPALLAQIPANEHISVLFGEDTMYSGQSLLVGWGAVEVRSGMGNLPPMQGDWWFGHFNYDVHTPWTGMESQHLPVIGFPGCIFFRPRFVLRLVGGELLLSFYEGDETEARSWWSALSGGRVVPKRHTPALQLRAADTREEYLQKASQLRSHLLRGDIYEVNYCRFFTAEGPLSDNPIHDFCRWMKHTSAPFSAYYTTGNYHLLCASPERFLCKRGDKLIAQPIKGTTPRHPDPKVDEARKNHLRLSEKERAENVMIVDLMRNYGSIEFARAFGQGIAEAATDAFEVAFAGIPDSPERRFVHALIAWMLERES
jgi:anthranilate/para-aminobenzoate synthase component I